MPRAAPFAFFEPQVCSDRVATAARAFLKKNSQWLDS